MIENRLPPTYKPTAASRASAVEAQAKMVRDDWQRLYGTSQLPNPEEVEATLSLMSPQEREQFVSDLHLATKAWLKPAEPLQTYALAGTAAATVGCLALAAGLPLVAWAGAIAGAALIGYGIYDRVTSPKAPYRSEVLVDYYRARFPRGGG